MSASRFGVVALVVAVLLGLAVAVRLAAPGETWHEGPSTGDGSRTAGIPESAEPARVAAHVDGDTIRLTAERGFGVLPRGRETTVRLLEIDTPEHGRDGATAECYAEEASRALADMLPTGSKVWTRGDRELLDPYGRTLLYLWTTEGVFVNLELVRQGYAEAVLFEPNDEYIDTMREAEDRARTERRGLWGACRR
ncbi:MAG TPA: thermonuclease family protein [Nocardioidaceae bacterium]|nr:thermonuclease family protein [Nocardioidaceae bacterium]